MIRFRHRFVRLDERGTSTVEFALVVPAFLALVVGGMHLSMLGFTTSNLHYAAEEAARCGAIQTTRCTSATLAQNAASAVFTNLTGATAVFTATPGATCGYQVTGTVTYPLNTGAANINVPLSATACYPV